MKRMQLVTRRLPNQAVNRSRRSRRTWNHSFLAAARLPPSFDKGGMTENEQYEGLLIRSQMENSTLTLVLDDFQDGFPPDLSEEVRVITITGVEGKDLNHEGLKKTILWRTPVWGNKNLEFMGCKRTWGFGFESSGIFFPTSRALTTGFVRVTDKI